jgi:hypothetical protein
MTACRPIQKSLTLSTPHHALKNLAKGPLTRPNNFMMLPQICRVGCPQNVNSDKFTLITPFSSDRDEWMRSKCINIHDPHSPVYELTDEYDFRKALAKNFFMLLNSYQNHPEAKSLGPDGKPCDFDTQGLLHRAHVIANWPPVYIGKESDRHWEEGEGVEVAGIQSDPVQAKGKCCRERRTIGAYRESSEARIHAAWNQSAHAGENLQAGTRADGQTSQMPERARTV